MIRTTKPFLYISAAKYLDSILRFFAINATSLDPLKTQIHTIKQNCFMRSGTSVQISCKPKDLIMPIAWKCFISYKQANKSFIERFLLSIIHNKSFVGDPQFLMNALPILHNSGSFKRRYWPPDEYKFKQKEENVQQASVNKKTWIISNRTHRHTKFSPVIIIHV